MSSIHRLLTPLSYLRIERQDKITDELVIPGVITFLLVAVLFYFSGRIPVFSEKGVISVIVGYLQIVSGFYIASLAAVATFNKDSMDKPMPGIPVLLRSRRRKKGRSEALSRRRFLCFLFGYLSFMSLFLYFGGSALVLLAPHIKAIFTGGLFLLLKWAVVIMYIFLTSNMLITTLLGLYYMTDRIHRREATFVKPMIAPIEDDEESDEDDDKY
ncbi:hypothetical protein CRX42_05890 [Pseudomonas jessenii]|uniref:Uncharacterized protein n=1 Tax=Pseudomonas jessenii TaxID=77298 RepID=A0A2W0EUZ8_PSEJE|nr:hypothetical protein [Pseudomonas jessenii]PYY71482.1 hypothetical protein CRX42_05890 [Pseudomonas jessenii]